MKMLNESNLYNLSNHKMIKCYIYRQIVDDKQIIK